MHKVRISLKITSFNTIFRVPVLKRVRWRVVVKACNLNNISQSVSTEAIVVCHHHFITFTYLQLKSERVLFLTQMAKGSVSFCVVFYLFDNFQNVRFDEFCFSDVLRS